VSRPVYGLSDIHQSSEGHSELTGPKFVKPDDNSSSLLKPMNAEYRRISQAAA